MGITKVFVNDNTAYAGSNTEVYGSTSDNDNVVIIDGSENIKVDQNVEKVGLPGDASTLKFKQAGNQVQVFDQNDNLIAAIPVQSDGTELEFSDGTTMLAQLDTTGDIPVMKVGDATLPTDEAGFLDDASEDMPEPETVIDLTPDTDVKVGTDGDDVFNGVVSTLSAEKTLTGTDSIDGGAGDDTLNVTLKSSFSGFTTGKVENVENIVLTNDSTIARTFDATGITGAESYTINAANAPVSTLQNLEKTVDITLNDQKSGSFDTTFAADAAEISGTEDAMNLTLKDVGVLDDPETADTDERSVVDITLADIEEININSTGTANVVDIKGNDLTTLTLSGEAISDVTLNSTNLTSVDASSATGNVTLDTTPITSGNKITTVKIGSGDDLLKLDTGALLATATIDGGAGDDTLSLNSSGATVQYTMAGVETLALEDISGALTFSGKDVADLTNVTLDDTASAATDLVKMGASDLTITATGDTSDSADVSSDHAGSTVLNLNATATAIEDKAASGTAQAADFTFSETSELTINVNEYANSESDVTAAKANSLVLNVASGKNDSDEEQTVYNGVITADSATSVEIQSEGTLKGKVDAAKAESIVLDAKGLVNTALKVDEAKDATITLAANENAHSIAIAGPKIESLTVKAGSTLDLTQTNSSIDTDLTAVQVADITIDKGLFDMSDEDFSAMHSLTLAGAGDDSQVKIQNVGADSLEYDVAVTATGLKGGLTLHDVKSGSANKVDIDVNGVTGDVVINDVAAKDVTVNSVGTTGDVTINSLNSVTVNSVAAGNVTVNNTSTGNFTISSATTVAKNVTIDSSATGTTDLAAITAADSITVDLDGSVGAVTLNGLLYAKAVTLKTADTIGGVTYISSNPTIKVEDSATVTLSNLQANTMEINVINTTSADTITVDVTGGIKDDTITVEALATSVAKLDVTMAGDLGNDTLVLDNANAIMELSSLSFDEVETIEVTTATDSTHAAIVQAADVTGKTFAIKSNELTIKGTDSADTIDMNNVTEDSSAGKLIINGGKGADTITLSAAVDTVVLADTAANNGEDTIIGFTAGASNDVLDISAFNAVQTSLLSGSIANSLDATSTPDNVIVLDDIESLTADNFGDTASSTVIKTAASKKYFVLADDDDADTVYDMYYVTTDSNNAATVELVGHVDIDGTIAAGNIFGA